MILLVVGARYAGKRDKKNRMFSWATFLPGIGIGCSLKPAKLPGHPLEFSRLVERVAL